MNVVYENGMEWFGLVWFLFHMFVKCVHAEWNGAKKQNFMDPTTIIQLHLAKYDAMALVLVHFSMQKNLIQ